MKKKILCVALTMAMVLSFAACNTDKKAEDNDASAVKTDDTSVSVSTDGVDVKTEDEQVSVGTDGVDVKSGDGEVSVGADGVDVKTGDGTVSVGADGVKIDGKDGEISIDLGGLTLPSGEVDQKTMEELFVMDATLVDKSLSPHYISYNVTDKSFADVLSFIKKGMAKVSSTATMESEDEESYSFTGKYIDGKLEEKSLIVSISYNEDDKTCDVSITY